MQVVVKKEIISGFSSRVLRIEKRINPELCVNSKELACNHSELAKRETNDCVVRAFMSALDLTYDQSHAWVKKYLKRQDRRGTYTYSFLSNILGKVKNGFEIQMYGLSPSHAWMMNKVNIITNPKYKKPTGYTIASFIENHPTGRYFVIVDGHAVAVINGKLYGNTDDFLSRINRRIHYVIKCK
jgi:hypothetical protein